MRVKEQQSWINQLVHGLSFATDSEINGVLLRRYWLYAYLLEDHDDMHVLLQSTIDMWKDYIEQLYATTQFEYNPIENYDRYEEAYTDTHNHLKGSKVTTTNNLTDATKIDSTTTVTPRTAQTVENYSNGYDNATYTPDGKTVQLAPTGEDTTHITGSDGNNFVKRTGTQTNEGSGTDTDTDIMGMKHIHGNIGVMSTQQMIQQSRDIIIDILDVYVSKFATCFDVEGFIDFNRI